MAKHLITTDDLTGEQGAETVVIVVGSEGIELDLGADSVARLMESLAPYWTAAPKSQHFKAAVRRASAKSSKPKASEGHGVDPAEIRAWAVKQGIEVPTRGRIPRAIVDQFLGLAS